MPVACWWSNIHFILVNEYWLKEVNYIYIRWLDSISRNRVVRALERQLNPQLFWRPSNFVQSTLLQFFSCINKYFIWLQTLNEQNSLCAVIAISLNASLNHTELHLIELHLPGLKYKVLWASSIKYSIYLLALYTRVCLTLCGVIIMFVRCWVTYLVFTLRQ